MVLNALFKAIPVTMPGKAIGKIIIRLTAFLPKNLYLESAKANNVPGEEMPKNVLILSDMQFDLCVTHDDSAIEMIARKYENAGYNMPKVVFWNLRDAGNVPVKFDASGVALVSGFSPAIMKSILAGKEFTPEAIMMDTIMNSRYDL